MQQELDRIIYSQQLHGYDSQNGLLYQLQIARQQMAAIQGFLEESQRTYTSIETQLRNKSSILSSNVSSWQSDTFVFHHDLRLKNNSNISLDHKPQLGFTIVGNADFSAYQSVLQKNIKGVHVTGNVAVGHASASGTGSVSFLKDGKFSPSLNLDAEARLSLFHGEAKASYQKSNFGVNGDVAVDVGTASTKVKAVISKDEVSLQAEYGVAALSGKAHGRISLFGFHVDATLQGEFLSFGGGAEYSQGKSYVEIGGKLSLFAGLGFKIRISRD